jgi:hypothetical protein
MKKKLLFFSIIILLIFSVLFYDYTHKRKEFNKNIERLKSVQFNGSSNLYWSFDRYQYNHKSFPNQKEYNDLVKEVELYYGKPSIFIDPFSKDSLPFHYVPFTKEDSIYGYMLFSRGPDGNINISKNIEPPIDTSLVYMEYYSDTNYYNLKDKPRFKYLDYYFGNKDILVTWGGKW